MKIPSRFKLFGQTISVVFKPEMFTEGGAGSCGFSSFRLNQIQLRPSTTTYPQTEEQIAQTFWHELTHFILYWAGSAYSGKEDYMYRDEGFVDLVGSLLHQATETFEYESL